jgi:threonine synthase
MSRRPGILAAYRRWLPVTTDTPALTLQEGDTPLLDAPRLADHVGVARLLLKVEGANPTGSFKDRGMVVAVAKAIEAGARSVLCASTGNTSASAAAYAARAGVPAIVLLPAGKVATGKLAQATAHGARIVVVRGNFDAALELARAVAVDGGIALVNSVNPHRIAGQQTAAFEIVDALGDAPAVLAIPVGNGGNITAYRAGFVRYAEAGLASREPRMLGVQAAGAAPFVKGSPVADPETVATAIRIGRPATWQPALDAVRDSGGAFLALPDDEILDAYRRIAALEGVFCEPASAASVAGLRAAVGRGLVAHDETCVCVLTGNGLKDADRVMAGELQATQIDPTLPALRVALGAT